MRTGLVAGIGMLFLTAGSTLAQSEKDVEKAFEQSVLQGEFYLRNFSAASTVNARYTANIVQFDPPIARSLLPITIDEVRLKGKQLELDGRRPNVVWDRQVGYKPGLSVFPVRILLNWDGADKTAALPSLREALFFLSRAEALAALPREDGGTARFSAGLYPELVSAHQGPSTQTCDCADKGTEACRRRAAVEGATPMKILHMADPEFSSEARGKKIGGNVQLSLVVDETGHATDVWVVGPLGLGLDEKAVEALQGYVFQPATCHNQPVKVPLRISVNFQIF